MTLTRKKVLETAALIVLFLVVLISTLSYIYSPDLKKIFIAKVSEEASSFIGQEVEIGDFSFSPTAGINVYNIRLLNPEGFAPGPLLVVKRLYLKLNFRALLGQKFYFREITLYSPELTLVRNTKGSLNISGKLMHLFEKKSKHQYRIDEFNILKGAFGLDGEDRYSIRNVRLYLKPLASGKEVKTLTEGSATYYGGRIDLNGWVYLEEDPKRADVSVSSGNLSLQPIRTFLRKYGINTDRTKVACRLNAKGDTEKGFRLRSEISIDYTGFPELKKEVKEILLGARAFLDISERSLSIDSLSLRAKGITTATASGKLRARNGNFFYSGSVKIKKMDLSAFNLVKDFRVSGKVTSDLIRLSGDSKAPTPRLSGTLQVHRAAFRSKDEDIDKIQARLRFLSGKEMKVEAEGTGHISKVYGYPFERSGNVNMVLNARQSHKGLSVKASINVSPVETHLKGGREVRFESISLTADGTVGDGNLSGKGVIKMKGIDLDTYRSPWLKAAAAFGYGGNVLTARDACVEAEDFKVSANATVRLPEKRNGYEIGADFRNIDASYIPEEATVSKTDVSARLKPGGKYFSGTFGFSIGAAELRGAHAGSITGTVTFDGKNFSADISGARTAGGKLRFSVRGKTSGGPFPLIIASTADDIDLAALSKEMSNIITIPYHISGHLKKASFAGTVLSRSSLLGNAGLDAEKVSLRKKNGERNILKDFSLVGTAEFMKKDLGLKAEAKMGKVFANISGGIKNFLKRDKSLNVKFKLPPVKAADIRESFWDVFPDSLLYAGLNGSLSSDLKISYNREEDLSIRGKLNFDSLVLRGENGEYEIGPVNGTLPVAYAGRAGEKDLMEVPSFERSQFESLTRYYARMSERGYSRISVGSLKYGFRILDNLKIWIAQRGTALNIKRFSGNIFGGKLNGSAAIDFSKGVAYRAGFLVEGMSLTRLCDEIGPIKGYISGKLEGTGLLVGSKAGLSNLTGRLNFRTYGTKDEKTMISREFLKKIGGLSLKRYLGDRPFGKGIMDLYLKDGFVIFKNLDISHTNFFGMTDLSIKVAPYNNRIAIDHLLWSITEAAQRAENK